ncbi:hypothetical protein QTP70_005046 [Hemibagrus guttatus]|uniref:Protein-tyrosine-phosphatase n=1 Tax=Hemibagrus guttatus TaxID=175788 RepID=A0AAE0PUH5_9TELE|nr:hypothetical protein QTP70_005046 [Hemibagrus guttatus]
MGRGSPIPPMLRRKIVEQYQKGVSQRKNAKSLKFSSSTVHNIIQRFRESGTISVRKGQGRKTILDARDLRALRRHCITYRNATVMEITTWVQEYFQKTLSVNTIHRAIRRCRLKLYRSKKKPYLSMIQKHRHFLWAKAHLKWTVAKWKTVLWSDESKFEVLFGKLGCHVIRTKEDKDNPSCYQRSVQKPASLMVWGCMSACGMGSLHIWKGTINAERHNGLLMVPYSLTSSVVPPTPIAPPQLLRSGPTYLIIQLNTNSIVGDGPVIRREIVYRASHSPWSETHGVSSLTYKVWHLEPDTEYRISVLLTRPGEGGTGPPGPPLECNVMIFTGTWFNNYIPSNTIELEGHSVFRADRSAVDSGRLFQRRGAERLNARSPMVDSQADGVVSWLAKEDLSVREKPMRPLRGLTASEIQPRQLVLQWEPLGYNLTRCHTYSLSLCYRYYTATGSGAITNNATVRECLSVEKNMSRFTLRDLPPFRPVHVRLALTNPEGKKESREVTFQTDEDIPGGIAPESLTLTPLDDMIFLKWEEPVEPNGLITQYEISYQSIESFDPSVNVPGPRRTISKLKNETYHMFSGLQPGTTYLVSVRARTAKGFGQTTLTEITTNISAPAFDYEDIPAPLSESESTITVLLRPALARGAPVSFQVITYETRINCIRIARKAACKDHKHALEISQNSEDMGLILGASAGGLVVFVLLLAAIVIIVKKGRKKVNMNKAAMPYRQEKKQRLGSLDCSTADQGTLQQDERTTHTFMDVHSCSARTDQRSSVNESSSLLGGSPRRHCCRKNSPYHTGQLRPAVRVADLLQHINQMKTSECYGFKQEYESFFDGWDITKRKDKTKGRHDTLLAHDRHHVKMHSLLADPNSDYVNANYIDGYQRSNHFIATQGPKQDMIYDFWRMVWQENCYSIVMITKLVEVGRVKCCKYWPDDSEVYGDIKITLLKTETLCDYIVRTFTMERRGYPAKHEVCQFHFTSWPEHGVPYHATGLLAFLRRVKASTPPDTGPVVVHCRVE